MPTSVTSHPDNNGRYARNTVPDVVISQAVDAVIAELKVFGVEASFFVGSYLPDYQGLVRVNLQGLYEDYLSTDFPFNGDTETQYTYLVKFQLTLKTGGSTLASYEYYVANALLNSSTPFVDWADGNFLTNQPIEKRTYKDAPEHLTYLDAEQGDRVLKVRFYPITGGTEDVVVFTSPGQGCYTVNVSYSRLVKMSSYLPRQLNGYYDLILFDAKGPEICRQRYIYEERTGREKYFLFVNALGGIDTLVCRGENTLQPELTLNTGRFDRLYKALDDAENTRSWTQQTGNMPYRWRNWLYELMTARQGAWKYENGGYLPVVVKTADIAMGDGGQLASASFGYMMESVCRAISDTERAADRTLHQSVAQQAEPLEDMTVSAVLAFEPDSQNGFKTEAVAIPASHVYVTALGNGSIYYYINGVSAGSFNTATDRMPVVIELTPGDELQFFSQAEVTESLTINYYPDEDYISSQTASAQEQTAS